MRLIDAEKAKEALTGWDTDPTDEEIEYTIDHLPTIEATPVVHGQWDKVYEDGHFRGHTHKECGGRSYATSLYCPNCGAKMDGGVSDG